ncbi:MAG: 4-hydroxybenzoate polyprenyltransferase [Alphaproteobacteria bacterium]|nr:4-hydroxybenzoate polyprenyltransferase [Alphaproteobacteria bacterium]
MAQLDQIKIKGIIMSETTGKDQAGAIQDAPGNWVDRRAPAWARPYLRLARLDRPIGTWLLLWPCCWAIALASGSLLLLPLFALGAIVMRGAGCTFNDIVDRALDAKVARTANRPLPSGAVSLPAAWTFLVAQACVGLMILLMLNPFAIAVGVASLLPVAVYPFMKRITYWPQLFLGLAFNWGALLGWAAVAGELAPPAIWLYLGGLFWTLGYDTIYALQDVEDDALIGVKSSALRLGARSRPAIAGFYGAAMALFALAGWTGGMGWGFWPLLGLAGAHLAWQVWALKIDNPANCLRLFRANRDFGALLFMSILAGWI